MIGADLRVGSLIRSVTPRSRRIGPLPKDGTRDTARSSAKKFTEIGLVSVPTAATNSISELCRILQFTEFYFSLPSIIT